MAEESNIEKKFKQSMESAGWMALKLSCPGFNGMPDRMILKDNGQVFFAEIKATGEKPRALQQARMNMLERRGFRVYLVDRIEDAEKVLHEERMIDALSAA